MTRSFRPDTFTFTPLVVQPLTQCGLARGGVVTAGGAQAHEPVQVDAPETPTQGHNHGPWQEVHLTSMTKMQDHRFQGERATNKTLS